MATLTIRNLQVPLKRRLRPRAMLLESLHEPPLSDIAAAWDAGIVRRVEAYKQGEVETCAAAGVFAEARCIAPQRRHKP